MARYSPPRPPAWSSRPNAICLTSGFGSARAARKPGEKCTRTPINWRKRTCSGDVPMPVVHLATSRSSRASKIISNANGAAGASKKRSTTACWHKIRERDGAPCRFRLQIVRVGSGCLFRGVGVFGVSFNNRLLFRVILHLLCDCDRFPPLKLYSFQHHGVVRRLVLVMEPECF